MLASCKYMIEAYTQRKIMPAKENALIKGGLYTDRIIHESLERDNTSIDSDSPPTEDPIAQKRKLWVRTSNCKASFISYYHKETMYINKETLLYTIIHNGILIICENIGLFFMHIMKSSFSLVTTNGVRFLMPPINNSMFFAEKTGLTNNNVYIQHETYSLSQAADSISPEKQDIVIRILKFMRNFSGITAKELADIMEGEYHSRSLIAAIENGIRTPTSDFIQEYSAALQKTLKLKRDLLFIVQKCAEDEEFIVLMNQYEQKNGGFIITYKIVNKIMAIDNKKSTK